MSTVDCAVITNLGHALLGKVLAGKSGIHFTRASVGDGVISEGKSPEELTELVHEIKAGDISGVDNPGSGEVRVSIQVSSLGVSVGFFVKEIGIFATDPDLGEILYAYVSMPDKPQWIRPEGASINTLAIFDVYVAVSRAAEVTAQICPSAMVHISDFESYKTYVETQLSSKAEAEPPQKFELPLAEGWTKYQQPYYQRNAFGEVTIWGAVKKDSAIAQGDVITTMPEGFRIPVSAELPAIKLLEGAPAAAAVFVRSYGDITAATTSTGSAVLSFVITYAGQ
ncbi:phage tail protein [Anaerotruncus colihominis]|uniref:phage tail-collar fiber domain-containing protein n=2 Tax=Anaerotruncus colihominis TaxID=169435 RepID=UPI0018AB1CFB|nr:phage tail protein [Anaerotruncus colihominis]